MKIQYQISGSVNFDQRPVRLFGQNHQLHKNRKQPNSLNPLKLPPCDQSRTAAVDVLIFIVVIGASGFLVFPYVKLFFYGVSEIVGAILSVVKDDICRAPMVYASMGLGIFFSALGVWSISKWTRTGRKCGNPNCRGLRKSVEFDIQIETEENVKNSNSPVRKYGSVQGLLEFVQEHHKDLENELRKMAPANGRAVIVFRARCGCPIGRMEVPGQKKLRKIKRSKVFERSLQVQQLVKEKDRTYFWKVLHAGGLEPTRYWDNNQILKGCRELKRYITLYS
ncbi:hypothetical protein NE237_006347 [Protea cynaroides]|uniref:Ribosomal protein L34e superfamily protein n=1 Tax=Protea cynaroides TaxID=273540 RepID=A0A9Q0KM50_9MAGN|nr:hypothetical protein NE237_006347 [Protea cynaroides]